MPFADEVAGLVGERGQGYPFFVAQDFLVYVRREDASELLAFQIEHFSESFAKDCREVFAPILGEPIMEQLVEFWAQVTALEPRPLRGLSDEEFEQAVRERGLKLVVGIAEADEATRVTLADAYNAQ